MKRILLINPNTSEATTAMMTEIARRSAPAGWDIRGRPARSGVPMIVTEAELAEAAREVLALASEEGRDADGVIVAAFGDPALEEVREALACPVSGLCEASVLAAADGATPFGIATVTPGLAAIMMAKIDRLGLRPLFTGVRLTEGDPHALVADPSRLDTALGHAIRACIADGARRVIIGGGPLAASAERLAASFPGLIVAPVAAAVRAIVGPA